MQKILVVDDDKTLQVALTRYLKQRGFMLCNAMNGMEGLALFKQALPDLVISDVMMPQMNGFEFCSTLREMPVGQLVPFIFLTTCSELDDCVQGYKLGADDFLVKPFRPRELLAKIESQLERRRRVQAELTRLGQPRLAGSANAYPPEPLPLSPAETRVFWEVVQGYTNRQVSERLFLSPRTVQSHLSHILDKLNLENRVQLVCYAYRQGYLPSNQEKAAS
ncbi:MAG: response regulator transcription factor [Cyanobacteria bacterium P01_G01_bin.38]